MLKGKSNLGSNYLVDLLPHQFCSGFRCICIPGREAQDIVGDLIELFITQGVAVEGRHVTVAADLQGTLDVFQRSAPEPGIVGKVRIETEGALRQGSAGTVTGRAVVCEQHLGRRRFARSGRADKQQIQRMMQVTLNLARMPAADEADTMAVALASAWASEAK